MAGLLGNIAGALGNNMAQYAHTRHQSELASERQTAQQDFLSDLEAMRAERAEQLALRSRKWQIEDRDALQQTTLAVSQAEASQKHLHRQVDFAREDLGQVNQEVKQLRQAIDEYDPMSDMQGTRKAMLMDTLAQLRARRARVMESIPDDVLQQAGPLAHALHRELEMLQQTLQAQSAADAESAARQPAPSMAPPPAAEPYFRMSGDTSKPSLSEFWQQFRTHGVRQAPGSDYLLNRGNF